MYCLFCVILCIVLLYMCTVLLPPGGYPIAVKYVTYHIISYHIISYHIISYHIISYHIISYHIIYHIISYIISYYISYHIISYHISSYISSYHIISYHIISYHIISYHIIYRIVLSYHIVYHMVYHISYIVLYIIYRMLTVTIRTVWKHKLRSFNFVWQWNTEKYTPTNFRNVINNLEVSRTIYFLACKISGTRRLLNQFLNVALQNVWIIGTPFTSKILQL